MKSFQLLWSEMKADIFFYIALRLEMDDAASKRLLNVKLTASPEAALVEMLYPAIYKFSCMLDLRFFPFDMQVSIKLLLLVYFPRFLSIQFQSNPLCQTSSYFISSD